MAWRISQATGASLMADYVTAHLAEGEGACSSNAFRTTPTWRSRHCARFDHIILVGAKPPVGFFAYPGKPSTQYRADTQLHVLTRPDQDPVQALDMLARLLRRPRGGDSRSGSSTCHCQRSSYVGQARLHPRCADAGERDRVRRKHLVWPRLLSPHPCSAAARLAAPHGGAIGDGLPVATGAAIGQGPAPRHQPSGRRLGDVFAPIAVDAGARASSEHNHPAEQPSYAILVGEYGSVGATPGPLP